MSGWLNKHPDAHGHKEALAARGESRSEYLLMYLCWMRRRGEANTTAVESSERVTETATKVWWWNEWKSRKEFGDSKFELWNNADPKVLDVRPDPLTGSTQPEHIEYGIPQSWAIGVDKTVFGSKIEAAGKSVEADFVNMQSLRDAQQISARTGTNTDKSCDPETGADPEQAVDPEKPEDVMQKRAAEFLASPSVLFKELSNMVVEGKELKTATAALDELSASYVEGVEKHIKVVEKARAAVDRVINGLKLRDGAVGKMLGDIDKLKARHDHALHLGGRILGIDVKCLRTKAGGKAPAAKRRRSAS